MQLWLSRAAMQQDYVLSLTFLAWASAAVLWWRFSRGTPAWDWLPWSAGAGLVAGALELFVFTQPVTPARGVPSYLWVDRVHGGIVAVMVAGWFLSGGRGWADTSRTLRRLVAAGVVGVAAARWFDPEPGLGGLGLAVAGAACLVARPGWARGMSVLALWAGGIGPLAEALSRSRRWTDSSEWGLLWSLVQLAAALVALVALVRDQPRLVANEEERREWRPLFIACGLWLVAGLGLGAWMGGRARQNFETAVVSRAETSAALMDREVVAAALGERFQLHGFYERERPGGMVTRHAFVRLLAEPAGLALRRELGKIERANRDLKFIYVSTLRDGWVVDITSDQQLRASPEGVGLSSREEESDRRAWAAKTAVYVTPYPTFRGLVTAARAPLLDGEGRMLGWVTFELSTAAWSASQSQTRLLVFVIVALGLGLAVLVMLQRRRVRERELARAAANASAMADQMKTAFLAKVSHELRTPIQSILGYSELLRGVVADPTARNRLAALRQHGQLMLRLVNDLLDLSAIQAGAFRLNERPVSFAELVSQTVDSLRSRADAKHLRLLCHIDPAVPAWARVDGERVRQVVLNLVGNAIKFTDVGQVNVTLTLGDTPEQVRLTVTDTGPGIPVEAQARLFQPFSRLEATAAKEGTGLGLSLAAALCRSMQGAVTLDSQAGGGACFIATFRAPPCEPHASAETTHAGALAGRRVLIAEDNTLVRELFVAFLEDEGASCVVAADGEAAVAAGQREVFDAVVLDLGLPRLDGLEVARRLRLQARPGLRIVGVSAHAGEAEKTRALAAGMDVFLTKPVELSALAAALDSTGQGRRLAKGEELRARLTAQFRAEAAVQRAALATALAEGDRVALQAAAHYLMNSAAVVRDDPLFVAAGALEQAAIAADPAAMSLRWSECERALRPWLEREPFAGDVSPALQPNRPPNLYHE